MIRFVKISIFTAFQSVRSKILSQNFLISSAAIKFLRILRVSSSVVLAAAKACSTYGYIIPSNSILALHKFDKK